MIFQSRSAPQTAPPLVRRDLAEYGIARLRDQVFDAVLGLWMRRKSEGWTQKRVAEAIGRDPAWVSRNLRAPGNWTLRIAGELIQGLDGEAEMQISALEDPLATPSNFDAYEGYLPARSLPQRATIEVEAKSLLILDLSNKRAEQIILANDPLGSVWVGASQ